MRTTSGAHSQSRGALLAVIAVSAIAVVACTGSGAAPSAAPPSATVAPGASASAPPPASTAAAASSAGGGRGDYDYGTGAEASPASQPPGAQTIRVNTATASLGTWLTGPEGLTLYTFKPDSPGTSTCLDDCAQAWPPFIVGAGATLEGGDGVSGELTTFERPDGTLQVAYDGAPLYYFASDTAPGDTNGQGLGDRWFVAEP